MRNIGGSVGIAIMTTFLARRTQIHQNHLVANITPGERRDSTDMLQGLQANFYAHGADAVTASRKSIAAMYGLVQQHAAMLAFVEAFWVMGVVFLLMMPFLPLLQYSKRKRSQPAPIPPSRVLLRAEQGKSPEQPEQVPDEDHYLVPH